MSNNFKMFVKQFQIIFSFFLYFVKRLGSVIVKSLLGTPYKKADQTIDFQQSLGKCCVSNNKITIPVYVFFTTIPIEVELRKSISGLMTLKCSCLQYFTKDGILYGKATFETDELHIHFEGSLKVLNIGPSIVFDAVYTSLKILIELKLIPVIGKCLIIDNFWIDEMNVRKCSISGTGPFNTIGNFIFSKIIDPISFSRFFIEFQIKRLINLEFSKFIPCVQVLQYSTTKLRKDDGMSQHIKVAEKNIKDGNNSTKLRVNFLGLEREIGNNENFCSSISNVLMKELLKKIGLLSEFGSMYKRGIVFEYLYFARKFKTDLDLGLISSEEFGFIINSDYESSSNDGERDSLFESSCSQNSSNIESEFEDISHNSIDFGIESLNSEHSIKSMPDYHSVNITDDSLSCIGEEDCVNEMVSKSDGRACVNEIAAKHDEKHFAKNDIASKPEGKHFANEVASKPEEKHFANEMTSKPEEKHVANEKASKPEEKHFASEISLKLVGKDSVNDMALKPDGKDSANAIFSKSDGIKENYKSVKFVADASEINLSDANCSELNTTQLDQSCKDSEICDEIDSSAGSLSSDLSLQSEEGFKCIEYICYFDCFLDSSDYEVDLKCATSNNQLHLRCSENL